MLSWCLWQGQARNRCWHCPGGSRDVPEWEMLPLEHSGCFQGLVPVLARTCVPRHKLHVVPALPAFFHLGGLSPGQDVRLWRGHQLRVAALTPKPHGGQSGLRPGPRQCRACGLWPFWDRLEILWVQRPFWFFPEVRFPLHISQVPLMSLHPAPVVAAQGEALSGAASRESSGTCLSAASLSGGHTSCTEMSEGFAQLTGCWKWSIAINSLYPAKCSLI